MTRGGIEPTTIELKAQYRVPFDYLAILGVALPPLLAEAHPTVMQLFTLRSSCRTVYFISTIITG